MILNCRNSCLHCLSCGLPNRKNGSWTRRTGNWTLTNGSSSRKTCWERMTGMWGRRTGSNRRTGNCCFCYPMDSPNGRSGNCPAGCTWTWAWSTYRCCCSGLNSYCSSAGRWFSALCRSEHSCSASLWYIWSYYCCAWYTCRSWWLWRDFPVSGLYPSGY